MPSLIAAINVTLDGCCDHTAVTPDAEIHAHYADLLDRSGTALYGRVTYQLMTFWKDLVETPSGVASMDAFAITMDRIPKVVFSRTLTQVDWHSARLATRDPAAEVVHLKQQPGGDLLVGSPGLIATLLDLGLVDELQLMVHPVLSGGGRRLFPDGHVPRTLRLTDTRTFASGAVLLTFEV